MATLIDRISHQARVTIRNHAEIDATGNCVVYWMQRAQRSSDNPALNVAVEIANDLDKPAVVFFRLRADAHNANHRHYHFMLTGLREITAGLVRRRIGFALSDSPEQDILRFCHLVKPCLVIGDEDPLRRAERGRSRVERILSVPFWTVDADVIVPSRLLGKEHFAARTIRPKIHALLPQFLKPVSNPVARCEWHMPLPAHLIDPVKASLE